MHSKKVQNDQDPFPAPEQPANQYGVSEEHQGKAKIVVNGNYTVSRRERKQNYHLLLILHVKNPTSYKDLRAVHGEEYESFR